MLSFRPAFSLSSFTFIKRLFSSSLLSAIRVVSSAYLRSLIFLPETLIPACDSSSLAFHMMYSAYELNKQGDNIQPWHIPFPILNESMFSSNFCFLTRILDSQEAGKVVWYSHVFKNFPQFIGIHTVKGFSVVNEAEVDVFLEFSSFFYDPMDVGNFVSGSSLFSKYSLNIWKFSAHILLKPSLEDFDHHLVSMLSECSSLNVFWYCPCLGLEWKLTFSSPLAGVFQICWHIECSTLTASSFMIWNSSAGII